MVGADLANLVNEAALLAARRGHDQVMTSDFADALERIVLGAERKVMMSPEDRRRTAYHEGGHAIVGMLTPGADPVRKISIIPRGQALGVTFSAPDDDRFNYERSELEAKIKVALGGRAAEEIVFGDITTGAESDIQQLTQIARYMVGRWGMSEAIGPVAVTSDGRPAAGPAPTISPRTQELIDEEVRRIADEAHERGAGPPAREPRRSSTRLAEALLAHETLDEDDAYAAAGHREAQRWRQSARGRGPEHYTRARLTPSQRLHPSQWCNNQFVRKGRTLEHRRRPRVRRGGHRPRQHPRRSGRVERRPDERERRQVRVDEHAEHHARRASVRRATRMEQRGVRRRPGRLRLLPLARTAVCRTLPRGAGWPAPRPLPSG